MRYETLNKVHPGDILAYPIMSMDGKIFLQQNVQLTDNYITRLLQLGYTGVYIFDSNADGIMIDQHIPLQLKIEAAKASSKKDISQCLLLSKNIADCLYYENYQIKMSIDMLGSYDTMTQLHSTNVAIYSGMLGILLGYTDEKLRQLILAALLHDIGKTEIDINILNKPDKLSDEERELINTHPKLGYNLLKDMIDIPSVVRVTILQHHENYDGSGYPTGLSHSDIHEFAQIIHICDVYDAMISRRSYKKEIFPTDVIEYLMANSGKMFHPALVRLFVLNLIVFPEGVKILLSDQTEAFVKQNNKDFPMRPIVIRIETKEQIDLTKQLDLTIIKILV